ncbi:GNAT family N-acetyltransferase [Ornithinimicrobium cavernae]|uniref:GNAT family N-acetyltransferase n=1 Tax=Ornithinimicrobium cavernae TaxID=2666047 RepID=UPI00137B22F9|nr:GNAT family N-acetyltransferase [Ornithinimicrobium cavernae]
MGPGTEQIIRRAWADLLGVAELGSGSRVLRVNEQADTVSFVQILGQGILSGPRWALDRAADLRDEELALLPVLMGLASDHHARPLGAAELSYTDTPVEHADLSTTQDAAAVAALEHACSPEDVEEVGLAGMPHRWVILERATAGSPVPPVAVAEHVSAPAESEEVPVRAEDAEALAESPVPLAGAGYVVWADALAHMGVLTNPSARGRGYGVLAAAVGTNAALAAGLIPQWRARWDNEASKRLAQALGYELAGTQTTVFIDA